MTRLITALAISVLTFGGCLTHHRTRHNPPPPPPRHTVTVRTAPPRHRVTVRTPPPRQTVEVRTPPHHRHMTPPPPPPPSRAPHRVRAEAPPAHRPPPVQLTVSASPGQVRRGNEVVLHVNPPQPDVAVYFMGRPLPKKTQAGGGILRVRVPSDASSGFFEVEWRGQRYRSNHVVVMD